MVCLGLELSGLALANGCKCKEIVTVDSCICMLSTSPKLKLVTTDLSWMKDFSMTTTRQMLVLTKDAAHVWCLSRTLGGLHVVCLTGADLAALIVGVWLGAPACKDSPAPCIPPDNNSWVA